MARSSRTVRLLFGTTLAGLVAFGAAPAQSQETRAAIEAGNKQVSAAFAKGDAAALAALYTRTAEVFPPGGDVAKGKEAIQKMFQGAIDAGVKDLTLSTVEVEQHGDTAHEVGFWTMKGPDGAVVDHGKYVVVWKKEQGRWKLHRDIWNSSTPPKP